MTMPRSCTVPVLLLLVANITDARVRGVSRLDPQRDSLGTAHSAQIYFINLDERKDKLRCMQKQLQDAPWPVHRFSAVNMDDTHLLCPLLRTAENLTTDLDKKNTALVCSNLLIWKDFLHTTDAGHLIIFEDDVAIRVPQTWQMLEQQLRNPCEDWDYLMVDAAGHCMEERTVASCPGGLNFFDVTFGCAGSQMQVISRAGVEALVAEYGASSRVAVLDKIIAAMRNRQIARGGDPIRAFAVSAGLAPQARYLRPDENPRIVKNKFPTLNECDESVWTTGDRKVK